MKFISQKSESTVLTNFTVLSKIKRNESNDSAYLDSLCQQFVFQRHNLVCEYF